LLVGISDVQAFLHLATTETTNRFPNLALYDLTAERRAMAIGLRTTIPGKNWAKGLYVRPARAYLLAEKLQKIRLET
jgi:hypothetical protein